AASKPQLLLAVKLGGITPMELDAIDFQLALDEVHVGLAPGVELQRSMFLAVEQTGIKPRVGMNRHRAILAVGRSHEAQLAALGFGAKRLLFVAGLDAAHIGFDPDLQKVRLL